MKRLFTVAAVCGFALNVGAQSVEGAGGTVQFQGRAAFDAAIKRDIQMFQRVIKAANISAELTATCRNTVPSSLLPGRDVIIYERGEGARLATQNLFHIG